MQNLSHRQREQIRRASQLDPRVLHDDKARELHRDFQDRLVAAHDARDKAADAEAALTRAETDHAAAIRTAVHDGTTPPKPLDTSKLRAAHQHAQTVAQAHAEAVTVPLNALAAHIRATAHDGYTHAMRDAEEAAQTVTEALDALTQALTEYRGATARLSWWGNARVPGEHGIPGGVTSAHGDDTHTRHLLDTVREHLTEHTKTAARVEQYLEEAQHRLEQRAAFKAEAEARAALNA